MEEATPSAALVEQNLEHQRRDQIVDQETTINSSPDLPSLHTPSTPPLWDQHPHDDSWAHNDVNNPSLVTMRLFSLEIFYNNVLINVKASLMWYLHQMIFIS